MLVSGYTQIGGRHAETAACANLLAAAGIVSPATKKPFTESMLLGLGGGVGGGCWVFNMCGSMIVVLGFRNNWQYSSVFVKDVLARAGATVTVKEGGGKKAAASALADALDSNKPALVWVDRASVPYLMMPPFYKKAHIHLVTVCGRKGDAFVVDDLAPSLWTITGDDLTTARTMMPYLKNRLLTVDKIRALGMDGLRRSIDEGLAACLEGMLSPKINNFGLPAIEKWAKIVTNTKDKKNGWPHLRPGPEMLSALKWTFLGIEYLSPDGAMRGMYAEFLDEAAEVTGRKSLARAADRYRDIAGLWKDLAKAALPAKVPAFKKASDLLSKRSEAYRKGGPKASQKIAEAESDLDALDAEVKKCWPLTKDQTMGLFEAMRERLVTIAAAERAALEELQRAAAA